MPDEYHWLDAIGVSLLVFLATLPVAVPFIFMQSREPLIIGIGMVLLGILLVGFTAMLGGRWQPSVGRLDLSPFMASARISCAIMARK